MKTKVLNIGNNPFKDSFIKFSNKESLKWQLLEKMSYQGKVSKIGSCGAINEIVSCRWQDDFVVEATPHTIPYSGGTVNVKYGGTLVITYSNGFTVNEELQLLNQIPISGRTDSGEPKYRDIPLEGSFEGEMETGSIYWDGVTQLGAERPSFYIDMKDTYTHNEPIKLNTVRSAGLEESDIEWVITEATTPIDGTLEYDITDDYNLIIKNHFIGYVSFVADAQDCDEQTHIAYIECKEHGVVVPGSEKYTIENLTTPLYIDWNEPFGVVEYDLVERFVYYDGCADSITEHKTIDSRNYFGKTFENNTTPAPITYDGVTESWHGNQKSWQIIQKRNDKGIANVTYSIEFLDNGKSVEWYDTEESVNYIGRTIIKYYDDTTKTQEVSKVVTLKYDKNGGLAVVTHKEKVTFPEEDEGFGCAEDIAIVYQKAGAKDVKNISYKIIDVKDQKWVEWDVTSTTIPFKVEITKTLNDDTKVGPETISRNWSYQFDKNESDHKEDRTSIIKYPNDGSSNYAQSPCVTYQYGANQIVDGSETYEVTVINRPCIEWDELSADISLNLITRFKLHNGKNGETINETVENVSGWDENTDSETKEITGMTLTDWHGKSAKWFVDQKGGKQIIETSYVITDVADSIADPNLIVEYNTQYYQVPFTGETTIKYVDSRQNETQSYPLTWNMSFDRNDGNSIKERLDTIEWQNQTKDCMIKQHGAKEDSGERSYKIADITPFDDENGKKYLWNQDEIDVYFTGETYVVYRDKSVAETPLLINQISEKGDIRPNNTSNGSEMREDYVTWPDNVDNPDTARWQCYKQGGKEVSAVSYKITQIRPLIGTVTPEPYLNYDAVTVSINYTGETTYTYVDTSTSSIEIPKSENQTIKPHTGESATERDIREGEVVWPNAEKKVLDNNKWSEYIHGSKEFVTGDSANSSAYTDNVHDIWVEYNETKAPLAFVFHLERLCYDGSYREDLNEQRTIKVTDKVYTDYFGENHSSNSRDISGTIVYYCDSKTKKGETYYADVNWKGVQGNDPYKTITAMTCSAQQVGEIPVVQWNITSYEGLTCKATVITYYQAGEPTTTYDDFTIDVDWASSNTSEELTSITDTKLNAIDLSSVKNSDGSIKYPNIKSWSEDSGGCKPNVEWTIKQHGKWEVVTGDDASNFSVIMADDITAEWDEASKKIPMVYEFWELCYFGLGEEATTANSKVTQVDFVKNCTKYKSKNYRQSAIQTELSTTQTPDATFDFNDSDESRPISGQYDYESPTTKQKLYNNPWKGNQGYNNDKKITGIILKATQYGFIEDEAPKIEYNVTTATIQCTVTGQYFYESGKMGAEFDLKQKYSFTVDENNKLHENNTDKSETYSGNSPVSTSVKDDAAISDKCRQIDGIDWYPTCDWILYQWGAEEFLEGGKEEYNVDNIQPLNKEPWSATTDNVVFDYHVLKECHDHNMREDLSLLETGCKQQVAFGQNPSDVQRNIGWNIEGCTGKFDYKEYKGIEWIGTQQWDSSKRVTKIEGKVNQINVEENKNPLINWNQTTVTIEYTPTITYTFEDESTQDVDLPKETVNIGNVKNNTSTDITGKSGTYTDVCDLTTYKLKGQDYCNTYFPPDKKPDLKYVFYQHGEWEIDDEQPHVYSVTSSLDSNTQTVEYNVKSFKLVYTRIEYGVTYGGGLRYLSETSITDKEVSVESENNSYINCTYDHSVTDRAEDDLATDGGNYSIKDKNGDIQLNQKLNKYIGWILIQKPNPDGCINSDSIGMELKQSSEYENVKLAASSATIPYNRTFTAKTTSGKKIEFTQNTVKVNGVESTEWDDVKNLLEFTGATDWGTKDWTKVDVGKTKTKNITNIHYTFPKVRNVTSTKDDLTANLSCTIMIIPYDVSFYRNGSLVELISYDVDDGKFTGDTKDSKSYDKIELSSNVTNIATGITSGKDTLKEIVITDKLTSICASAFTSCSALTTIGLTDNITQIGESAFEGCESLSSVTIPDNDTYTVIKTNTFKGCSSLSSVTIPEKITTISKSAFSGDTQLCDITFSKGLTTIGEYAFTMCYGGSSMSIILNPQPLVIPDTVTSVGKYAFYNCKYLPELTLSTNTNMTTIEVGCFANCSAKLSKLDVPKNIKTIKYAAFSGDTQLCDITFSKNDGLTDIGAYAFSKCYGGIGKAKLSMKPQPLVIPDTVTSVGSLDDKYSGHTFEYCTQLPSVTFSKNVETITENTFAHCTDMTSCDLQAKTNSALTYIHREAFTYCTSLTGITFPVGEDESYSLKEIHEKAFFTCTDLKSVYITKNISRIGDGDICGSYTEVFSYCPSLASVKVDSENTTYYSEIYEESSEPIEGNCCLYRSDNKGCVCFGGNSPTLPSEGDALHVGIYAFEGNITQGEGSTEIIIPDIFTEIHDKAFYDCSGISTLTIDVTESKLNKIGTSAFENCTGLAAFIAPNSLQIIQDEAFRNCYGMNQLDLNEGLGTIGNSAFNTCYGITQKTSKESEGIVIPKSVTSIGDTAFSGCSKAPIINILSDDVDGTSIGQSAFTYCSSAEQVIIGPKVNSIGQEAFTYTYSVSSITVSDSNDTFKHDINKSVCLSGGTTVIFGCHSVTNIPDDVTTIGNYAFKGNIFYKNYDKDISIQLNDEIKTIGDSAFYNCDKLKKINLDTPKLERIDWGAFSGASLLSEITISSAVTGIGSYAFSNCKNLTDLTYQKDTTKVLRTYATYISAVTIPTTVTEISKQAFSGCTALLTVTNFSRIQIIGEEAFYNCRQLTSRISLNAITRIGSNAFDGCGSANTNGTSELFIGASFTRDGSITSPFTNITHLNTMCLMCNSTQLSTTDFEGCKSEGIIYVRDTEAKTKYETWKNTVPPLSSNVSPLEDWKIEVYD